MSASDRPMELGPNSGPRLAATACPMCDTAGGLSIVSREVFALNDEGSASLAGSREKRVGHFERVPVMQCKECGQELVGGWDEARENVVFDDAVTRWRADNEPGQNESVAP